ncbi:Crp/Fnr family transcriptional regulator [Ideonella alba]|uniref:Crp/Fnr family transcriptional regulator n=1 Tax=Ideonella alba TaxID=2824118 RepID=A0A941BDN4_9BURK|nr:Crp/Fnr family transcriptional regulator [Ideonella alba]MBQ0933180.1 Crp/Fnr family transcriptional regulator [Ideonella alba]
MAAALPDIPPELQHLPEVLQPLAVKGVVRQYRSGTLLIQEGDQGDTIYLILQGQLRVFSEDGQGHEITYGTYGPGEYIGEMNLDGGPRSASVITDGRCVLVTITRETLTRHIAEHPDFAFELLAKVIRRARVATLNAKALAFNDVYGRLKRLLEEMAVAEADGTRTVSEPLTHKAIAGHIGCSREMVSRVMKSLSDGGYLLKERKTLKLTRPLPARW